VLISRSTTVTIVTWIEDLERRSNELLPGSVAGYIAAALGRGQSHQEGIAAWDSVRFCPRVFTDSSTTSTGTSVLGTPVQTPVLVAPMNQQVAVHPCGEVETGRGVAAVGSLLGVSTYTEATFPDIHAAGAPWWYQVYVLRDRELTGRLAQRAAAAGASALMLTVDVAGLVAATPSDGLAGPDRVRPAGLTPEDLAGRGDEAAGMAPQLGTDTIPWLRDLTGLPVVVKGVLRGDDAARCVDSGADGIVVSTHGGRRLDPAVSAPHALPQVLAAVAGGAEVYVDSGLRSGNHVAAALALGARAVFIGRPAMWGLAADGADGVAQVIDTLTQELRTTMRLLGIKDLSDFTPDLLAPA